MKQSEASTRCAGLDIGKMKVDASVLNSGEHRVFDNKGNDFCDLIDWLKSWAVRRVGLEASGGYERKVQQALAAEGFEVVVHQPLEVKRFAQFKRIRLKNDKADAQLIAQATAQVETVRANRHPDLIRLAEMMRLYEHLTDLLARCKAFAEHLELAQAISENDQIIDRLKAQKADVLRQITDMIRREPAFNARFEWLKSVPGIGDVVAASLLIRMPELGELKSGQAAALLGVAPFDRDSGTLKGRRFIKGGRSRPRRHVYLAAVAAKRTRNSPFKAFAERLKAAGKPPKVIIIAVMRKLIETANTILAQKRHWQQITT